MYLPLLGALAVRRFTQMDLVISAIISIVVIAVVAVVGDYLYIGIWYYFALPVIAYFITLYMRPKRFFLSGVCLAISVSYIPYFYYNMTAVNKDGLLGLGHVFSLFGLGLGILLAAWYAKNKQLNQYWLLGLGFTSAAFGFVLNQAVICNTVMYCGIF